MSRDDLKYFFKLLCITVGVGVLSFLVMVSFKYGIPRIPELVFYVFIGLYLMFAGSFIDEFQKRRMQWSNIRYSIGMIALWMPVTLINTGVIYGVIIGMDMPLLLWAVLVLAWIIVPVNMMLNKAGE